MMKTKLSQLITSLCLIPFGLNYAAADTNPLTIKLLGINDFHGQITTGKKLFNQPVGGAAVLASYLKRAQLGMEDRTVITIMGDLVGASPPASGLLHDEPTILFTNSLGNTYCNTKAPMNPVCNVVATIGNHEFDKGQKAMFDLIYGADKPPTGDWIPLTTYPGANYPYISANIVDTHTQKTLFPPYTIKMVHGIPIAFIGAVLKDAAGSMFPENAKGVTFLDEAQSINQYIPEIKSKGAHIIIVLIHEGGTQTPYYGDTRDETIVKGTINKIVDKLDDDIDVVMAGHTHAFLNAYLPNHNGVKILVTEAQSYSASFAEVSLQVDTTSQKVIHKSARIITTYANRWPGTIPDEPTQKIVQLAENAVAPVVNSVVGNVETPLLRRHNKSGESNLGNLITDAFRTIMDNDIGLTNPHGMRDDITEGVITWGNVYSVLPFGNKIVTVTLTGKEISELLEQQWMGPSPNILQISGLKYTYNSQNPIGHKIINIQHLDKPLIEDKTYTIATTDFLASGSGVFTVMKKAKWVKVGLTEHETLVNYIKQLPQPFSAFIEGRIKRV